MSIFGFISKLFKPAADLVDNLHTSEEEKLQLKNNIIQIQTGLEIKILEYEKKLVEAQAEVINAEATGHSWLQRNWRPITMITFLILVVLDSFGLLAFRLSGDAWILLKIGLGGYVIGRSAEKIAPKISEAIKKKDVS